MAGGAGVYWQDWSKTRAIVLESNDPAHCVPNRVVSSDTFC